MYMFFCVFGAIFVVIGSAFINYIYEIFPINKITNFLAPIDNKGIWSKISIATLPILIWSCIEIAILGSSNYFIVSVIFNIAIASAIIFIIKYSYSLFSDKENNIINLISIFIGAISGQFIAYLILNVSSISNKFYLVSIIGLCILIGLHILISLRPPKSTFFRG